MTDSEALLAGAATAWHLAREAVFPGEAELVRDLPKLTVEGQTLRIEFRLQQDFLGPGVEHDRTMVALRFVPTSQATPALPWTLHVRGDWPERTDRFPRVGPLRVRRLRKALTPTRRRDGDPHRDTFMSEDVYVMPQTPPDDLTAQVVLFVWQTAYRRMPNYSSGSSTTLIEHFTPVSEIGWMSPTISCCT